MVLLLLIRGQGVPPLAQDLADSSVVLVRVPLVHGLPVTLREYHERVHWAADAWLLLFEKYSVVCWLSDLIPALYVLYSVTTYFVKNVGPQEIINIVWDWLENVVSVNLHEIQICPNQKSESESARVTMVSESAPERLSILYSPYSQISRDSSKNFL